jgi:hypothetical protein
LTIKEYVERGTRFLAIVLFGPHPPPLSRQLAWADEKKEKERGKEGEGIAEASCTCNCHTERRQTKREVKKML